MFDGVITLFCRYGPPKADAFARAVVHGVNCTAALGQTAGTPHDKSRDRAMLVIPRAAAAGYVAPAVWHGMTQAEREGKWTLQPGDIFVPGEVFLPSAAGQRLTEGQAEAALRGCDGFVITTVTQRLVRGPMAHFAVGAGSIYQHGGGLA